MYLTDFNRPSDSQEAYTRTDLSLRYESSAQWMIEAFVQNVEDEAVKNNVDLRGNQPGAGGVPGFAGRRARLSRCAAHLRSARVVSVLNYRIDMPHGWGRKAGGGVTSGRCPHSSAH